MYNDSLNWAEIKPAMQKLLQGAKSIEDTRDATNYLLSALRKAGDKHSFFSNKKTATKYKQGNALADKPKSQVIGNHVGYIYVPALIVKTFELYSTIKMLIRNITIK